MANQFVAFVILDNQTDTVIGPFSDYDIAEPFLRNLTKTTNGLLFPASQPTARYRIVEMVHPEPAKAMRDLVSRSGFNNHRYPYA